MQGGGLLNAPRGAVHFAAPALLFRGWKVFFSVTKAYTSASPRRTASDPASRSPRSQVPPAEAPQGRVQRADLPPQVPTLPGVVPDTQPQPDVQPQPRQLVMDNLNTHAIASLYKIFPAQEARRIARKLEIHYTPKHGSWLDIAEIELNVMTRQCLSRRIADINELRQELAAWETDRNHADAKADNSLRYYQMIERGERKVSLDTLIALSRIRWTVPQAEGGRTQNFAPVCQCLPLMNRSLFAVHGSTSREKPSFIRDE